MKHRRILFTGLLGFFTAAPLAFAKVAPVIKEEDPAKDESKLSAETFSGLKLRSIGPALMSGRICDFAVHPDNPAHYYVAVCSGNVWKTVNGGTTFEPIFDKEGSYSIGCIKMDPKNPHVVWVGTGENNSQRSVSFGDGVYRSLDGGKNWENMGLKESEHIGMIAVDPRDSDVVYVAAQGPLWRSGGDRGLYKTSDGGKTWERVLHISDDTGVNEVHLDPRDPDVLYASAYQRRRHVWSLLNGGPESALYKSTDAGKTWRKIEKGLPGVHKGRIGLCIAPPNPDVLYAIVEAADDKSGVFRSTDRGETWEKRSDYISRSPQYYNELVCDPNELDRVYSLDTFSHVSEDGGKTFNRFPREDRHVDDHALWINPGNSDHMVIGGDGGVYETYDRGANWRFMANLPITQFYRVAVDNSEPFYYVYGGTQDNNTLGGPSRTTDSAGVTNADWFVTVGGDGFKTQVDPEDPNIVYSQWQHGGLVRHDRRSGEAVDIKPREAPGDDPLRWNWDSPLLISPHQHKRLYFAAQRVFRSDDQGHSWKALSGDLSRGLDRNKLKIMGRVWGVDAVAKNNSTSFYGNIVALTESPLVEDLLYVGTDDGLIQVTEDGGKTWRKIDAFPTVPDLSYVSGLTASLHDPDTVFACFDNHKMGDFSPYVLKSTDRGRTWQTIAGDLPDREIAYTLREDHIEPDLLFLGTEFGLFFTRDGGSRWIKLKGGMPTIAVQDLEIQRRENDVVLATFGRSFYILDDYSPLRMATPDVLEKDAVFFPIKPALTYIERSRLGGRTGRGSQGASFYTASNPPFGAVFTYYLKDKFKTLKEKRQEAEKKAFDAGKDVFYPSWDELRAEDEESEPKVLIEVRDADGKLIRRVPASRDKGVHRVSWDLRHPSAEPIELREGEELPPWAREPVGPLAVPGKYTATLMLVVNGEATQLVDPQPFEVIPLEQATFAAKDRGEVLRFRQRIARLQRAVRGALKASGEMDSRLKHLTKAYWKTPSADPAVLRDIESLRRRLSDTLTELRGDRTIANRSEPVPPSINERVSDVVGDQWYATSAPTQTQLDAYDHAGRAFSGVLAELQSIEAELEKIEARLEGAGAPWTPGRLPAWQAE